MIGNQQNLLGSQDNVNSDEAIENRDIIIPLKGTKKGAKSSSLKYAINEGSHEHIMINDNREITENSIKEDNFALIMNTGYQPSRSAQHFNQGVNNPK